jgi:hypothetical protein
MLASYSCSATLQESATSNLLGSTIIAIAIIGPWKMTRWGLWLTIAMSMAGILGGLYNLVRGIEDFQAVMSFPPFWKILSLFFLTYGGPIQLTGSILTIAYLHKRRRILSETSRSDSHILSARL